MRQEHCSSYFKRVFCLLATSYMTRRASESETLSPEALDDFGKSYRDFGKSYVLAQLNQANGNLLATVVKSAELYAEMRDSSLRSSEKDTIRSVFIFCKQKRATLPFSKKFDQTRSKNNMAV